MKKPTKSIIVSTLLAVAFGALSVGSTFALFTSQSQTEIEVQSGKVDLRTTASATTLKGFSMNPSDNEGEVERNDGTFYNGGTYALDGTILTLDKITPGDRVEFKMNADNQSNVSIKYRFGIVPSGDATLLNALKLTINGNETPVYYRSNWTLLEPTDDLPAAQEEMTVVVSLPKEIGNECQNLSASLVFGFEAVQGNAAVKDDIDINEDGATITSLTGWNLLAYQVNNGLNDYSGYTVKLDRDLDFADSLFNEIGTKAHPFKGSFDGNGQTVKNASKDFASYEQDESYAGLIGYFNHTDSTKPGEIKNLKAENISFTNAYYAGGIVGNYWSNSGNLHDCEVKNVTLTAARNGGGVMGGGWSQEVYNCKAENVNITLTPVWLGTEYDDGNDAGGLIGGCPDQGDTKVIRNNVVKNVTIKAYRNIGSIIGKAYYDHLTFKNNTVEGVVNFTIDQQTGWYGDKAIQLDFPGRTDAEYCCVGIGTLLGSSTSGSDIEDASNSTSAWNTTINLHA